MTEEVFSLDIDHLKSDDLPDADYVAFHAVFQCLVNLVEHEYDGIAELEAHVAWYYEEFLNEDHASAADLETAQALQKSADLYRWYKGVEWGSEGLYRLPDGKTGLTPHDRLKEAVEVMGCWWT